MLSKPNKKTDAELHYLIKQKIYYGDYLFVKHAKERKIQRNISDLDVLNILEGRKGTAQKRNKLKDCYKGERQDWNYCIEGLNVDGEKIRIIISFTDELMLIITVMRLE